MEDIKLLDAVERYIRGEMNPDERLYFENLRKTNPEVDQLVVEHTLFLQQMNRFGEWKKFRSTLHDVHTDLSEQGKINSARLKGRAKVVYLWKRYKKVVTIAAVIAGVTTLGITALVNTIAPKVDKEKLTNLSLELDKINRTLSVQDNKIKKVETQVNESDRAEGAESIPFRAGGTGFLVDGKGYLITNFHVVRNSRNIVVSNSSGDSYRASVVKEIPGKDIAILKISDNSFKPFSNIPYAIRKNSIDVAEPIFTLGYPGSQIVYTEGYLSGKTGYNGDTLSCQLGMAANRGNSGGPVFNKEGEIIGVISTKENDSEGVAFAIQSRFLIGILEEMKKEEKFSALKIPLKSSLRGLSAQQQVKKIQDYVFMVKAD
jgi:S1-C subfamily serine protease